MSIFGAASLIPAADWPFFRMTVAFLAFGSMR